MLSDPNVTEPLARAVGHPTATNTTDLLQVLASNGRTGALHLVAQAACRHICEEYEQEALRAVVAATQEGHEVLLMDPRTPYEAHKTGVVLGGQSHLTWATVVDLTHRVGFAAALLTEGLGTPLPSLYDTPDLGRPLRAASCIVLPPGAAPKGQEVAQMVLTAAEDCAYPLPLAADVLALGLLAHRAHEEDVGYPSDVEGLRGVMEQGEGKWGECVTRFGARWGHVVAAVRLSRLGYRVEGVGLPTRVRVDPRQVPQAVWAGLVAMSGGNEEVLQGLARAWA